MRQLYRDQRDRLALELEHRAGADVVLDVPDHGMHIVAYLRHGRSDVAVERAAATRGVVTRAISPLYTVASRARACCWGLPGSPRRPSRPPSRAWRRASATSRGAARYVWGLAPGDRLGKAEYWTTGRL